MDKLKTIIEISNDQMEVKPEENAKHLEKKSMDVSPFMETQISYVEENAKSSTISDLEKKLAQVVETMANKLKEQDMKNDSFEKMLTDLNINLDLKIAKHVQRHIQLVKTDLNRKMDSISEKLIKIERKTSDSEQTLNYLIDNDGERKAKLMELEALIENLKARLELSTSVNQKKMINSDESFKNLPTNVQSMNKEIDQIGNKIDETESKIVSVEESCHTISLSVVNLKDEIDSLKTKLLAQISNGKLQEMEKRLDQIDFRFSLLDFKNTTTNSF